MMSPKPSGRPTRLLARSGSCSSSLKKPAKTGAPSECVGGAQQVSRRSSQSSLASSSVGLRHGGGNGQQQQHQRQPSTAASRSSLFSESAGSQVSSTPAITVSAAKTEIQVRSAGHKSNSTPVRGLSGTLASSLREKEQQISKLEGERDELRNEARLMEARAREWEDRFVASELERSHVASEADDEVVELRRLSQELEDETRRLASELAGREQVLAEQQFKLDELECERHELREQVRQMGEAAAAAAAAAPINEQQVDENEELARLRVRLAEREEIAIQLRSSLEMRKNELLNLQQVSAELERKLRLESERSERHLKRIDEIQLEAKAARDKLASKSEENEVQEKQVLQLRQQLRLAEERLEQVSLARKKDVEVLHQKLGAARRGASSPGGPSKTPTPQDELVRLQVELREARDQLIEREAELDCRRRDLELLRRKMETRTLEVDANNQELARRCQDLLEQNRQSEETAKQLLRSASEHSGQLIRATDDLRESNGRCAKLREQVHQLEEALQAAERQSEERLARAETLERQVQQLAGQVGDLCGQLDAQAASLRRDRDQLAAELAQVRLELAQAGQEAATCRQDLRTSRLQTQEVAGERERLRADLEMRDKFLASRQETIGALQAELEAAQRSIGEYRSKVEQLRATPTREAHLEAELEACRDQLAGLEATCGELRDQARLASEAELDQFDQMRRKHSAELDQLRGRLAELEAARLESCSQSSSPAELADQEASTLKRSPSGRKSVTLEPPERLTRQQQVQRDDYESQIEFLNSLVVDMQRQCDLYKDRLAQVTASNSLPSSGPDSETNSLTSELDELMGVVPLPPPPASGILKRPTGELARGKLTWGRREEEQRDRQVQEASRRRREHLLNSAGATLPRHLPSAAAAGQVRAAPGGEPATKAPARISGRPYCDICSVFDLHHTFYCPQIGQKLATWQSAEGAANNNNNNNNNYLESDQHDTKSDPLAGVEEMFREYELSIAKSQFSSLRRRPQQQQHERN